MPKPKRLKVVLLTIIVLAVFVFIFPPLLGHSWRKKQKASHPPIIAVSDWKQFTSVEGSFSVRFPGVPEKTNMTKEMLATNVEVKLFYVNPNIQNSFTVGFADSSLFEQVAKSSSAVKFLNKNQEAVVSKVKGKVVFEQESESEGFPAREFEYVAGGKANYSTRVKYILADTRIYMVCIVFRTGNSYPEEREIFFNSFHILKK